MNILINFQIRILLFIIVSQSFANYHHLTMEEKKQFIIMHYDLKQAIEMRNYDGFLMHYEDFLNAYKNIMLDPDPKNRELQRCYNEIKNLYKVCRTNIIIDSLKNEADMVDNNNITINIINWFDNYLQILKINNYQNLDTEIAKFNQLQKNYYINNSYSLEAFQNLLKCRFSDSSFINVESKKHELAIIEEFNFLTCCPTVKKINEFRNKFSSLLSYEEDLKNLEERCKIDQLSFFTKKKNINIIDFNTYLENNGDVDQEVLIELKHRLMDDVIINKDYTRITIYKKLYPNDTSFFRIMDNLSKYNKE